MCLTTAFKPEYADPLNFEFMMNTFKVYFYTAKTAANENHAWRKGSNITIGYLLLHSFKNARSYAVAAKDDISDAKNDVKKVLANPNFSHIAHLFCELEDLSEQKAIELLRQESEFKAWYNEPAI